MNNEDRLRELIRGSIMEEGIMDRLFSRWRKGGSWKGNGISGKESGLIGEFIRNLETIHKSVGELQGTFPRKAKLIRGNLVRCIRDLEDLLISIERGRSEKDMS